MSLHDDDIKSRLRRFLDRKQIPRRLDGKENALQDEVAALVAAVTRNAPRGAEALAAWWPHFETILSEACGANWPTEREIRSAAQEASKACPAPLTVVAEQIDMRDIAIASRRMKRGEPVGENYLYGRLAVEMIAEGLIDRETMTRYRSGAFFARKEVYKEEAALAWEAEAKARHEAAKEVYRHRKVEGASRTLSIPDKSARFGDVEDFAA